MSRSLHRLYGTAFDLAGIVAALAAAGLLVPQTEGVAGWLAHGAVAVAYVVVWSIVTTRIGVHRVAPGRNLGIAVRRALEAWAATWGVGGVLLLSLVPCTPIEVWLLLAAGAVFLTAIRFALAVTPWGDSSLRARAIVIGSCPSAQALASSQPVGELDLVGVVPFTNEDSAALPELRHLGTATELPAILRQHEVDLALVSPSDQAVTGDVRAAFRVCSDHGLAVHYFPSFLDVDRLHVNLTWNVDRPGLNLQAITEPTLAHVAKRCLDIVGAGIGLVGLLPVFVACGLAVKLTSRGPIFFKQTRVGKGGQQFPCLKFRTMRVGAQAQQELLRSANTQDGPAFKVPADPRVTPIGRLLRKFSLDELPQLLNVLVGDMSLVGPRPPIPSEVDHYRWWQRRRISVKPGLTCLWQVYGRNRVSFKRWVEMDLFYIDNWSIWLDLKLIAHTFRAVLRGTGM
ncbi:MAG: sugar transferase [Planctomycetota bacterium]